MIPNELLRDTSISKDARFVFCVLASKPDNWIFYNKALSKELRISVDTLRKYINELVVSHWIIKVEHKFKANDYILKSTKSTASGFSGLGDFPSRENLNSYKEIPTVINTNNKKIHTETFNKFWNLYDKKVNAERCSKIFEKLTDNEIEQIFKTLPDYIESTPDKKYRKNPLTYLNQKSWNDEVMIRTSEQNIPLKIWGFN
jgi:hypothetical protein